MSQPRRPRSPKSERFQDFALYIAISTAIICVAVGGAIFAGGNGQSFLKWFNLAVFTTFIYGLWFADNKANLRRQSFWILTGAVFIVHTIGFALMLIRVEWFKPVWFAILAMGEFVVLIGMRGWFVPVQGRASHDKNNETLSRQ